MVHIPAPPTIEMDREVFSRSALRPGTVALVVFHASWCAPSRTQLLVVEALARSFAGKAEIGTVDVDREPALAEEYQARTLPTSVLLSGGEIVEILPGYQQEEFLKAYLDQLVEASAAASKPSS